MTPEEQAEEYYREQEAALQSAIDDSVHLLKHHGFMVIPPDQITAFLAADRKIVIGDIPKKDDSDDIPF